MKRSWIGLGFLLVLLAVAVWSSLTMSRIHKPVEEALQRAADCALREDWAGADHSFQTARKLWQEDAHFRACFADHTPVEDAEAEFALVEVYRATRENAAFAASCQELAKKTAAVGEAHEFVWWNLF